MYSNRLYQASSIVAALVVWQLAVGVVGVVSVEVLLPPRAIAEHTLVLLGDGRFLDHASATLRRTFVASVVATVFGVSLGVLMGWNDTIKTVLAPLFSAVYPIPVIALLPLVLLVFGTGDQALVFTAALGGFFVVLWTTMKGARQIRSIYFDVATDNGASDPVTVVREVLLPGSLPAIFVGLRLATNTALLIIVSAELVAGDRGLGYFLWVSYRTYSLADVYATLVVVGVVGLGLTYGLRMAAETLIVWRPDDRTARTEDPQM